MIDQIQLCEFGCDKPANYFFKKSGKHCCSKHPHQCEGRRSSVAFGSEYNGDQVCSYGCGKAARYSFKNGNFCCADLPRKCPEKKKHYDQSLKAAGQIRKSRINPETGLTVAQEAYIKATKTKKNTLVDGTGLTVWEAQGRNSSKTKTETVLENGRTIAQEIASKAARSRDCFAAAQKAAATKTRPRDDGGTIAKDATQKAIVTKKCDIDDAGQNMLRRAGLKAAETRRSRLAEDGTSTIQDIAARRCRETLERQRCDGILTQRARRGAHTRMMRGTHSFGLKTQYYPSTDIRYQGSLEYNFLNSLEKTYGSIWLKEHVSNPLPIMYFDRSRNQQRSYFPDFRISSKSGTFLIEVKSHYFFRGSPLHLPAERLDFLTTNICKLDAAAEHSSVLLCLDGLTYFWSDFRARAFADAGNTLTFDNGNTVVPIENHIFD